MFDVSIKFEQSIRLKNGRAAYGLKIKNDMI